LLGSCLDFEEEEMMLQSMGHSLGVLINRTPKCHPELAGEVIEYSWGCTKNFYQRLPLDEKRRKEKFTLFGYNSSDNEQVVMMMTHSSCQ
jgi:hypothetical protein